MRCPVVLRLVPIIRLCVKKEPSTIDPPLPRVLGHHTSPPRGARARGGIAMLRRCGEGAKVVRGKKGRQPERTPEEKKTYQIYSSANFQIRSNAQNKMWTRKYLAFKSARLAASQTQLR